MRRRSGITAALALCLVPACGGDHRPGIITVAPGASIQSAVDRAREGDVVLVAPGTYREAVVIDRPGITLRGEDRDTVVLDGGGELTNGVTVLADDVRVQNLTLHHYTANGVLVSGSTGQGDTSQLTGFELSYLTAYDNALYGLYAFQAGQGTISDSYVSGHGDSGIYVGQCGTPDGATGEPEPCDVVVRRVTAEYNAVGYEGTNASQVWVIESVFRHNRVGVTPNSQSLEQRAPQTAAVIAGNLVVDNDDPSAPEQASGGFGLGIAIGSGIGNVITKNRVEGNDGAGILVTTLDTFTPTGNRIEVNVLDRNGIDLGYWLTGGETDPGGNCFTANEFSTSSPADIETMLPCDGKATALDAPIGPLPDSPPGPVPADVPAPPSQPAMPGDVRALPGPVPSFAPPDLATITVPAR